RSPCSLPAGAVGGPRGRIPLASGRRVARHGLPVHGLLHLCETFLSSPYALTVTLPAATVNCRLAALTARLPFQHIKISLTFFSCLIPLRHHPSARSPARIFREPVPAFPSSLS